MLPCLPVDPAWRTTFERPDLAGVVETLDQPPFRLHFARAGDDAPRSGDLDGNGLPDVIDAFLLGLRRGVTELGAEGWRPLTVDDGTGGSDAVDVYVTDIDAFGYAYPIPAPDGTWTCFMSLDPEVPEFSRVAESVALHELHHCIQYRYTPDAPSWMHEAASTYEQYSHVQDPVLDLGAGQLWIDWITRPERPLWSNEPGYHDYSAFVFMKHWAEHQRFAPERLVQLWEGLAAPSPDDPTLAVTLDREARRAFGEELADVWLDHAVWNGFACARDDGLHYRPDVIPCVTLAEVPFQPFVDGERFSQTEGPFTAVTLERATREGEDRVSVRCDARGQDVRVALVAVDGDGVVVEDVRGSGEVVSAVPGGSTRIVVTPTKGPLDATCRVVLPEPPGVPRSCALAGAALVPFPLRRKRR